MYLKVCPGHKGRTYLSFVQGYRDENGKSKQKTIQKLGYLDDLKKQYDDPIAHFKKVAQEQNKEEINKLVIDNLSTKKLEMNSKPKNIGYAVLKKEYQELGIKELLDKVQKNSNIDYNLNDILSMLVYMRVIKPGSKRDNFNNMDMLFENYDFSLDDIYRALTQLYPLQDKIQKVMWENTKDKYHRDTTCSYYDCTNYYFEIDGGDVDIFEYDKDGNLVFDDHGRPKIAEKGMRRNGPEKNHRPDPIIEMGLLMDATFFPMSYNLFPGNESEKLSLVPAFNKTKRDFKLQRTIVVADRGLNTSDNIILIAGTSLEDALKNNGYVYGQSVRGADEEFKAWVLNQDDYKNDKHTDTNGNVIAWKHKSRIYPKKMYVQRLDKEKTKSGNTKKETILVDQKQMVYYSEKYAIKQKKDREAIIAKAKDLIKYPTKYNKSTAYGVAGYIKNLKFVKKTGEVADTNNLMLDLERIAEEEKYDGYYSIVTSEENLSDEEIRDIYRGLSRIEETFKITKSTIEARPVYVSLGQHIASHFLTCFIAFTILRFIEYRLGREFTADKISKTLRDMECIKVEHDVYQQTTRNEITDALEKEFNINFSNKYVTLSKIKKNLK